MLRLQLGFRQNYREKGETEIAINEELEKRHRPGPVSFLKARPLCFQFDATPVICDGAGLASCSASLQPPGRDQGHTRAHSLPCAVGSLALAAVGNGDTEGLVAFAGSTPGLKFLQHGKAVHHLPKDHMLAVQTGRGPVRDVELKGGWLVGGG